MLLVLGIYSQSTQQFTTLISTIVCEHYELKTDILIIKLTIEPLPEQKTNRQNNTPFCRQSFINLKRAN